jgi:TolB-like protein
MPSIIPGYEYDIFISYRQKDNKHDGWVTQFVNNLKDELESTFKEEISVYFDINPHDGLLETHDVDASLKEKLKCLIFIPVISRTYCDPKSFAFEHEFKAFVEQASKDQFGLKIKLPNGNVAGRVLPVQIHDLDPEDTSLLESVLGAHLRRIEFIYREPGVNRPLTQRDLENKNAGNTSYQNQINKTANATRELIAGIKRSGEKPDSIPVKTDSRPAGLIIRKRIFIAVTVLLILAISGLFLIQGFFKPAKPIEKSIAVLPFVNMSNNPEQEYFCDGMMQEILNNLYMIGGLIIPASTSSMRFKNSKISVREIARQLNVNYLLEGNVTRSGDHVRIIVRLIDGKTEKFRWTEQYDLMVTASDLLSLQSDVAQKVAKNMNVAILTSQEERLSHRSTQNTEAYDLYLRAKKLAYDSTSKRLLEKSIALDPSFSDAYVDLAFHYIYFGGHNGTMERDEVIRNAESLLNKAFKLDKNSVGAHLASADLNLYYYWNFKRVEKEYNIVRELSPSNSENTGRFVDYLLASGKFSEALSVGKKAFENNQVRNDFWISMALVLFFNNMPEQAYETMRKCLKIAEINDDFLIINAVRIYNYLGRYKEAIEVYEKYFRKDNPYYEIPYFLGHIGIAAFKTGDISHSELILKKLLKRCEGSSIGSPNFFTAALYANMNKKDKAIEMLERAYQNHEVEMYWLKVEPIFISLHGDPRFESLLSRIGF